MFEVSVTFPPEVIPPESLILSLFKWIVSPDSSVINSPNPIVDSIFISPFVAVSSTLFPAATYPPFIVIFSSASNVTSPFPIIPVFKPISLSLIISLEDFIVISSFETIFPL